MTHVPTRGDEAGLRKLGVNLTTEPVMPAGTAGRIGTQGLALGLGLAKSGVRESESFACERCLSLCAAVHVARLAPSASP